MSKEHKQEQYPFIRPPVRLRHLIPIVGGISWFREERQLIDRTAGGKDLTASLPHTREEFVEDIKTQVVYGSMLGYHASFAVLVGLGVGKVVAQILFQAESSKK